MAKGLTLFPVLTESLQNEIKILKRPYRFYYIDKNREEKNLYTEPVDAGSDLYVVKDETGIWSQDEYNIGFERKISIQEYSCLFGEDGVVCHDAKLGVAVQWKSADSKQRGSIPSESFSCYDGVKDFVLEYSFQKAQLRGRIDFTSVLYVACEGHPYDTELHLINTVGYILGELDTCSLQLDGSGSTFPVFEVVSPGQPLWAVKCDWIDSTADKLADCVSINLNKAHKNFKYIDRNQKSFNKQLLIEIMASAVSVVIEKARLESASWDSIIENQELEPGSVGEAIHYFQETLEWDLSSPETVSASAREFFEQRI